MKTAEELAAAPMPELAAWLVEQARLVRERAVEGDLVTPREVLLLVRRAAELASGATLDVLEVAEAFLKPLARSELSRREIAIRTFLRDHPERGEQLFRQLLEPDVFSLAEFQGQPEHVRSALDRLVSDGVLARTVTGLSLVPSVVPLARELVEPAPFRMWTQVERVRRMLAATPSNDAIKARALAAEFGVSVPQAESFLRHQPLPPEQLLLRVAGPVPKPKDAEPSAPSTEADQGLAQEQMLTPKSREAQGDWGVTLPVLMPPKQSIPEFKN